MPDKPEDVLPESSEKLELYRLRLLNSMQDDLTAWAKSRLGILSVAVAVLGFFGLSTIMNQTVQSLVSRPVEREIIKLEKVTEKAREQATELREQATVLKVLSETVKQAGDKARDAAAEANRGLDNVKSSLEQVSDFLDDLEDKSETLRQETAALRKEFETVEKGVTVVSDRTTASNEAVMGTIAGLQSEIRHLYSLVVANQELNLALLQQEGAGGSRDAVTRFEARVRQSRETLEAEKQRIEERGRINVVYYAMGREAQNARGEKIKQSLTADGFSAEVWLPDAEDWKAFAREVAGEFGLEAKLLLANRDAVYLSKDMVQSAEELRAVYSAATLPAPKFVYTPLDPVRKHLELSGGRSFDKTHVVLIVDSSV